MPADYDPRRESAAAANWRRTLSTIPTLLGQLEYLSSLRSAHSGHYEHVGLAQRTNPAAADVLLARSHRDVFRDWLELEQTAQREQTETYLKGLEGDKREIVAHWLAVRPWTNWPPAESADVERELFLTDLDDIVEAIRLDYRVTSPDRSL